MASDVLASNKAEEVQSSVKKRKVQKVDRRRFISGIRQLKLRNPIDLNASRRS